MSSDSASYYCALNNYVAWSTENDISTDIEIGCPLIEIPTPHGDLIDKEQLKQLLLDLWRSGCNYTISDLIIEAEE